jgi:hypothetical protein
VGWILNFNTVTSRQFVFSPDEPITFSRGFDVVTMGIPLHIEIAPEPNGRTWLGDGIEIELISPTSGNGRLLAIGDVPTPLESLPGPYQFQAIAELRCTPKALAEYERERNGGPVKFTLKARVPIHELENTTSYRKLLCETHYAVGQEFFEVDKVKWTGALRNIGLSASVLVEIPFPLNGVNNDAALSALRDAVASFENGGSTAWKDCVGHIRPFLEKWRKSEPTPNLEPKDGSAVDRKWKLLNYRDALYKCCHFWVHEAASEAGRDEALLALSSFAALLKAFRSA